MKCRVCKSKCFSEPLLVYKGLPASAQGFPELDDLENDSGADLSLFQCSVCGLVQLSGKPVPYYKQVIRAASFSDEMKKFRSEQFAMWIDRYNLKGKSVLEVGCGRGEYLSIVNQTDVSLAHGVEYSQDFVDSCLKSELSVTKGFFGDHNFDLPRKKFDGFLCLNFMEHWPDPNKSLSHLKNTLDQGAIGMIEVPNFNMILRDGLYSEFIADHLLYFTKDTLTFMLNYNGFEVVEVSEVWHDYILSAIVKKRKKFNLSHLKDCKLRVEYELNSFIGKFEKKQVAIWGAGHQSLAVMSLANLGDKIKYVVDSAPFKQGKYTPATHIPIVTPAELIDDPVEAVIIIAASYSDEVAKIIEKSYQHIENVAILENDRLRVISLK